MRLRSLTAAATAVAALFLVAASPAPGPADRSPDWLVKPSGEDLAQAYPERAVRLEVEGDVILACVVGLDGELKDCTVESETPPDMGFGKAALSLTGRFKFAPKIEGDVPVESAIRIPLSFKLPEGGAGSNDYGAMPVLSWRRWMVIGAVPLVGGLLLLALLWLIAGRGRKQTGR